MKRYITGIVVLALVFLFCVPTFASSDEVSTFSLESEQEQEPNQEPEYESEQEPEYESEQKYILESEQKTLYDFVLDSDYDSIQLLKDIRDILQIILSIILLFVAVRLVCLVFYPFRYLWRY